MIWTPDNIFQARDREVFRGDWPTVRVRLYSDGWALYTATGIKFEGLDVWTACYQLNAWAATLESTI